MFGIVRRHADGTATKILLILRIARPLLGSSPPLTGGEGPWAYLPRQGTSRSMTGAIIIALA
jgi:hypothetical protein